MIDIPSAERAVLLAAILATTMAFVDATALNVALPALQADLSASGSQLLWVINAYAIPLTACVLVAGAFGDRFGRKRVFFLGILIFALASLLCGLAGGTPWLIAARILQGVGAAAMIPGSLALITAVVPRERRGRVIGMWSALTVIAMALGPVIGGLLANWGLWRCVFFINLPLAAVCMLVLTRVPESRDEKLATVDLAGAAIAVSVLAGLSYALIEGPERGWRGPLIWTMFAVAGAGIPLFLWVEKRAPEPMLPLQLFQTRTFVAANLITILLYTAFHAAMLLVPLNLVQLQGYRADLAGLAQLPVMAMVIVLSPLVGRYTDRFGPRLPLIMGQAVAAIGLALLALTGLTQPSHYWITFFPPLLLLGAGMGLTIAPLSTTIMNSVEAGRAGVGSGINSMLSRLASVVAIALLGGCALLVFRASLATNIRDLSPASQQAVLTQASKFGDARPPANLTEQEQSLAQSAIRHAFLSAFRAASVGGVLLSIAGAITAAFLIPPKHLLGRAHAN